VQSGIIRQPHKKGPGKCRGLIVCLCFKQQRLWASSRVALASRVLVNALTVRAATDVGAGSCTSQAAKNGTFCAVTVVGNDGTQSGSRGCTSQGGLVLCVTGCNCAKQWQDHQKLFHGILRFTFTG
jgi:hypothetical protein